MQMVKTDTVKSDNKVKTILIVDDHPIVRHGVSRILSKDPSLSVCAEAETSQEALDICEETKLDAAIVDISLDGVLDGIRLTKQLHAKYPQLPILILSMHDEMTYAHKALSSGAKGYIMKEESSDKLVSALKVVLSGEIYVSEAVKQRMVLSYSKPPEEVTSNIIDILSERECEVFSLLGKGLKTRVIAEKLFVSVKTIETHRSRIKLKLGIKSTPELLITASAWNRQAGIDPKF